VGIAISAVTVCVGCSDFLEEVARHNRHLFRQWMVVTNPRDGDTLETCRRNSLDCLRTEDVGLYGQPFNKGRALARGISQLSWQDWLLGVDCDIVLPRNTLNVLDSAELEPGKLYGVDRVCLYSWEQWKILEASDYLHRQHDYHINVHPPNMPYGFPPLASRIMRDGFGYTPHGYFQLFHGSDGLHEGWRYKTNALVPETCGHTDQKFAERWDRRNRVLIPEIIAVHLESERVRFGTNWTGRRTRWFGPEGSEPKTPPTGRAYP